MGNCVLFLRIQPSFLLLSVSINPPLLFFSLDLSFQKTAKHKAKETYDTVTEKLGATPQSAREYKKGVEETASEATDGKRDRTQEDWWGSWELCIFLPGLALTVD